MRRWLSRVRRTMSVFFTGKDPVLRAHIDRCNKIDELKKQIAKKREEELLQGLRNYLAELQRLNDSWKEADDRAAEWAGNLFQIGKRQLLAKQEMEKNLFQGLMTSLKHDDDYLDDEPPKARAKDIPDVKAVKTQNEDATPSQQTSHAQQL